MGTECGSQPGFPTRACPPGAQGPNQDVPKGSARPAGEPRCLGSNPGLASFNHAVTQFPHLENGANSEMFLLGSLRGQCVYRGKLLQQSLIHVKTLRDSVVSAKPHWAVDKGQTRTLVLREGWGLAQVT